MELQIRELHRAALRGFEPYLLPKTRRALFNGMWVVLGAVTGTHACGAAAAQVQGRNAVLTDLFVDAAARQQGVAMRMMTELLDRLAAVGVRRVEADYVLAEPMRTAMDTLLMKLDFSEPQRRSIVFQTNAAQFYKDRWLGTAFTPSYRTPANIVPFFALSGAALSELDADSDIPSYLAWRTLRTQAELGLSVAQVVNGRVTAYLLAAESADNGCTLLAAVRRSGSSPTVFLALLMELVNRAYYRFGGAYPFYFSVLTPRVERLARRLLADHPFIEYEEHCCTLK